MNKRALDWVGNAIAVAMLASFVWLIWGWFTFSGLYGLVARLQLKIFGSFGAISTFAIGCVVIGGIGTVAMTPLIRRQRQAGVIRPRSRAEVKAMSERAVMKLLLGGGAVALLVSLAAGALLYRDGRRDARSARLDLDSPQPLPAGAGNIRLLGWTRPELAVDIESKQTPGVDVTSTAYMAVVGPGWRPGAPVPVIVQGSPGIGLPHVSTSSDSGSNVRFDLPSGFVRSLTSGFATYLLAQRGAIVDSNTLILDTRPDAERYVLLPVAALGGLLAAFGLAGGALMHASFKRASVGRKRLNLNIREINQGASGGSYHCVFEAVVQLDRSANIHVTVASVEPPGTTAALVEAARNAIQAGAADALSPRGYGASIDVTRLVIHEIDFKAFRFKACTTQELRRQMGASDVGF